MSTVASQWAQAKTAKGFLGTSTNLRRSYSQRCSCLKASQAGVLGLEDQDAAN